MFEGPVTRNIPKVLDNGEVTEGGSWLRASGRPGREHGSLGQQRSCHPVPGRPGHCRAGLEAGQQRIGAGNRTSGHGSSPGHHGRAGGCAREQHRAGGRGGHEKHPRRR